MRFSARHTITAVGCQNGQALAIVSAKGVLYGAVDELVTMLGEAAAYDVVSQVADRMIERTAMVKPGD